MTEQEWLTSTDPQAMLRFLTGSPGQYPETATGMLGLGDKRVSNRRLRLFACACRDCHEMSVDPYDTWLDFAIHCTQAGNTYFGNSVSPTHDPAAVAALLRDIFGNPFRPVVLSCAEWTHFDGDEVRTTPILSRHRYEETPTVLAVARSIYEKRCWDEMPILADALEEAGCDNADILNHCRGLKRCPGCGGTGKRNCQVDAGYNNPLMTTHGWQHCSCTNYGKDMTHPGWFKPRDESVLHARGCWVIDLILGKE